VRTSESRATINSPLGDVWESEARYSEVAMYRQLASGHDQVILLLVPEFLTSSSRVLASLGPSEDVFRVVRICCKSSAACIAPDISVAASCVSISAS